MASLERWSTLMLCSSLEMEMSSLVERSKSTLGRDRVPVAEMVTRKLMTRLELPPLLTADFISSLAVTCRVGLSMSPVKAT